MYRSKRRHQRCEYILTQLSQDTALRNGFDLLGETNHDFFRYFLGLEKIV